VCIVSSGLTIWQQQASWTVHELDAHSAVHHSSMLPLSVDKTASKKKNGLFFSCDGACTCHTLEFMHLVKDSSREASSIVPHNRSSERQSNSEGGLIDGKRSYLVANMAVPAQVTSSAYNKECKPPSVTAISDLRSAIQYLYYIMHKLHS
jgi:hypothetical protein